MGSFCSTERVSSPIAVPHPLTVHNFARYRYLQDGLLKMWDIRTNKEAAIFKPKNGAVRDVQFSPLVKFKSVAEAGL